jgi:hypothetical protein
MRLASVLASAAWLVTGGGMHRVLVADDFRILSRVYVGEAKEPSSQTTTIFREGLVYDCIDDPAEVVVFDANGGRFVLLEVANKLRAEITLAQIDALLTRLKEKLLQQEDARSTFLAAASFKQQDDRETGETQFSSPWLSYRVKAVHARNDTVAAQYAVFSWHYTRLNTLKHPMLLARAVVNDWLHHRKLIAEEVNLTTYKKGLLGRMTPDTNFRSHHLVIWGLSREDLRRIEDE